MKLVVLHVLTAAILFSTTATHATEEAVSQADAVTDETSVKTAAEKSPGEYSHLHRGLREKGFSVGFGETLPFGRFENRTETTMWQAIPSRGRFRSSTQEFIWEFPLVVFTRPDTEFLAGATLLFRQHLTSHRRFSPYLEIGAGANLTDLNIPEVGGRWQFSLQGGAGVRTALGKKRDLQVGLRWYHLSNGGLTHPNTGLNNYLVTVGYSQLY